MSNTKAKLERERLDEFGAAVSECQQGLMELCYQARQELAVQPVGRRRRSKRLGKQSLEKLIGKLAGRSERVQGILLGQQGRGRSGGGGGTAERREEEELWNVLESMRRLLDEQIKLAVAKLKQGENED